MESREWGFLPSSDGQWWKSMTVLLHRIQEPEVDIVRQLSGLHTGLNAYQLLEFLVLLPNIVKGVCVACLSLPLRVY